MADAQSLKRMSQYMAEYREVQARKHLAGIVDMLKQQTEIVERYMGYLASGQADLETTARRVREEVDNIAHRADTNDLRATMAERAMHLAVVSALNEVLPEEQN